MLPHCTFLSNLKRNNAWKIYFANFRCVTDVRIRRVWRGLCDLIFYLGCWEESNMSAVRHFRPSDVIGVSPWNFNNVSNLRFDKPSTKVACPALSWSCKASRCRLWECYLYIHVSLPFSSPHSLFVNCVNSLWFPRLSLSIA